MLLFHTGQDVPVPPSSTILRKPCAGLSFLQGCEHPQPHLEFLIVVPPSSSSPSTVSFDRALGTVPLPMDRMFSSPIFLVFLTSLPVKLPGEHLQPLCGPPPFTLAGGRPVAFTTFLLRAAYPFSSFFLCHSLAVNSFCVGGGGFGRGGPFRLRLPLGAFLVCSASSFPPLTRVGSFCRLEGESAFEGFVAKVSLPFCGGFLCC